MWSHLARIRPTLSRKLTDFDRHRTGDNRCWPGVDTIWPEFGQNWATREAWNVFEQRGVCVRLYPLLNVCSHLVDMTVSAAEARGIHSRYAAVDDKRSGTTPMRLFGRPTLPKSPITDTGLARAEIWAQTHPDGS